MLVINLLAEIIGTFAWKLGIGLHRFFQQIQQRDYVLLDHHGNHEAFLAIEKFVEMKLSCEPSEEYADAAFVSTRQLFFRSVKTGTMMMIAALLICMANIVYLPLLHPCMVNPGNNVTSLLRLIYDLFSVAIMQFIFLFYCCVLLSFRKCRWQLIMTHSIAAIIDTVYRVVLFLNKKYPCPKQHCYPMSIVWFLAIVISSCFLACDLEESIKKRIKVAIIIPLQLGFNFVSLMVINKIIAPSFAGLPGAKQMLLTLTVMVPCFFLKTICRLTSQRMKSVFLPGKIYILSMIYEINMKIEYRFLQAFIENSSTYIITSFVQVLISFFERTSILLVNYFLMWLLRKCFNLKETHRITPFTRRFLTDVLLVGFLNESISVVISTTLIFYGGYVRGVLIKDGGMENANLSMYLTVYGKRVGTNIAMELVFSILAVFLIVKYFNLPLLTLWSKTWKEKLLLTLVFTWFLLAYVGHDISSTAYLNANYKNSFPLFNCTTPKFL